MLTSDIDAGTIISFYNGVKVRSDGDWERPTPYKMMLDESHDINIPDHMTSLDCYSATLGHKVAAGTTNIFATQKIFVDTNNVFFAGVSQFPAQQRDGRVPAP